MGGGGYTVLLSHTTSYSTFHPEVPPFMNSANPILGELARNTIHPASIFIVSSLNRTTRCLVVRAVNTSMQYPTVVHTIIISPRVNIPIRLPEDSTRSDRRSAMAATIIDMNFGSITRLFRYMKVKKLCGIAFSRSNAPSRCASIREGWRHRTGTCGRGPKRGPQDQEECSYLHRYSTAEGENFLMYMHILHQKTRVNHYSHCRRGVAGRLSRIMGVEYTLTEQNPLPGPFR